MGIYTLFDFVFHADSRKDLPEMNMFNYELPDVNVDLSQWTKNIKDNEINFVKSKLVEYYFNYEIKKKYNTTELMENLELYKSNEIDLQVDYCNTCHGNCCCHIILIRNYKPVYVDLFREKTSQIPKHLMNIIGTYIQTNIFVTAEYENMSNFHSIESINICQKPNNISTDDFKKEQIYNYASNKKFISFKSCMEWYYINNDKTYTFDYRKKSSIIKNYIDDNLHDNKDNIIYWTCELGHCCVIIKPYQFKDFSKLDSHTFAKLAKP
jgi:hypothetical protein